MQILTQNLYGVDKDPQAVEVAQLNLLLKALHVRDRLPTLTHIRHGDSLISGTPAELKAAFGAEWQEKRAFNWQTEFPEIFGGAHTDGGPSSSSGQGFDVIVGNPPYVRQETLGEEFKAYASEKFTTYSGMADLYVYFIERALSLLKPGGMLGFIVANKWMRASYGKALRDFLATQTTILEIIDFGELPVFQTASTFPAIIIVQKKATQAQRLLYAAIKHLNFASLLDEVRTVGTPLDERALQGANWTLTNNREQSILERCVNKVFH